jgi:hypothetical protein
MVNPKDLIGIKKPPTHLVPAALILQTSMAMKNGADKYGAYNWRSHPVNLTVYIAAAQRHLLQLLDGEDIAQDSSVHHAAHVAACMGIILDALATGNLIDDRPVKGSASELIATLTSKGDNVPGHSGQWYVSNFVVPIAAPYDPSLAIPANDITYVVRPYDDDPNFRDGWAAVGDPVSSNIK